MTSWQRRVRAGVAIFGIATTIGVYLALGERRHTTNTITASPLEPRAIIETLKGSLERLAGVDRQYLVDFARSVTYDDGSARSYDVTIHAKDREGRSFVVTAGEAFSTRDNANVELSGPVTLREDDGFELTTAKAAFDRATGVVRADGAVQFHKGRMNGSGVGITYDENADLLHINSQANITMRPERKQAGIVFTSGTGTLDRMRNLLVVEQAVHVVHGEQVIETVAATAHLSENEDVIQFVELRGQSRVTGGLGSVQSMDARDMDLDYTDDGQAIERASLRGASTIVMAATGGAASRRVSGEQLDISMRPDNSLDRVTGNGQIQMTLPAVEKSPARTIKSETLDASGDAAGALKNAQFSRTVTFTEDNGKDGLRHANSDLLVLEMNDTAVASALFTGTATFTDNDLSAHAAEARYEPSEGMLRLRGRDKRGDPGVADSRVTVDAETIDIGLESRRIGARNKVKSSLLARKDGGKPGASAADSKDGHLPGLLQQDSAVSITGDELAYDGDSGRALYTGRAWLSQGDTDIRAQVIDIQQQAGDLTATGGVRSTLVFDSDRSSGEADVLRYIDADRTVTYTAPKRSSGTTPPVLAHVTGSQGDLRAQRIMVYLAKEESRLERLVAEDDVLASIEKRTARGARLVHTASDDTYKVTASRSAPAIVEEGCRETKTPVGTLTFSRSTDSMEIKGEGARTETRRKASCQ